MVDEVQEGGPYYPGTEVTLEFTWKVKGTPTDPTTPTGKVKKPDGTLISPDPTLTKQSDGVFTGKVTPAVGEEGEWQYYGVGDGPAKAAGRKMFLVLPQWQT
jgi:hypothetical protein